MPVDHILKSLKTLDGDPHIKATERRRALKRLRYDLGRLWFDLSVVTTMTMTRRRAPLMRQFAREMVEGVRSPFPSLSRLEPLAIDVAYIRWRLL